MWGRGVQRVPLIWSSPDTAPADASWLWVKMPDGTERFARYQGVYIPGTFQGLLWVDEAGHFLPTVPVGWRYIHDEARA